MQAAELDSGSEAFAHDPAAHYAVLRSRCPMSWQHGANAWLATRYEDVIATLRHPRMAHAGILRPWLRLKERHGWDFPTSIKVVSGMPFNYEGAAHAELRRCFARSIAPFADRHDRFAFRAERLLDRARSDGGFDLAEDFANRLLFEIICDLAEIGEADRPALYPMSRLSWAAEATISIRERGIMEETLQQAFGLLRAEVPRLLVRSPQSLLSCIHRALPEDEPDKVSATIVILCVMLMMGNDALGGCLGFGIRWLLDASRNQSESVSQGQWGEIADDLIRQTAPVDFLSRVAQAEATVGGVALAPGDWVMASPLSANHDAAKFGPDAGKITLANAHGVGLTFGAGRHLCLGMQMSRNVIRAGLQAIAASAELRMVATPELGKGRIIRNLAAMPVALG